MASVLCPTHSLMISNGTPINRSKDIKVWRNEWTETSFTPNSSNTRLKNSCAALRFKLSSLPFFGRHDSFCLAVSGRAQVKCVCLWFRVNARLRPRPNAESRKEPSSNVTAISLLSPLSIFVVAVFSGGLSAMRESSLPTISVSSVIFSSRAESYCVCADMTCVCAEISTFNSLSVNF